MRDEVASPAGMLTIKRWPSGSTSYTELRERSRAAGTANVKSRSGTPAANAGPGRTGTAMIDRPSADA